jgi:hypothetical protein
MKKESNLIGWQTVQFFPSRPVQNSNRGLKLSLNKKYAQKGSGPQRKSWWFKMNTVKKVIL